jgi:hypothetical protein
MDQLPLAELGQKPIDDVYAVLDRCWRYPVTVQSTFARHWAAPLAIAASLGLITVQIRKGTFGKTWLVTTVGLEFLNERE